jgi:outer membrane protein assembly factor BamB
VYLLGSNTLYGLGTTQVVAFSAADGTQLWHVDEDPQAGFIHPLNRALAVSPDGLHVFAGHVRIDPNGVNPPLDVVNELSGVDGSSGWTHSFKQEETGLRGYCSGCGPILALSSDATRLYLSGTTDLVSPEAAGNDILLTEAIDARDGKAVWSSSFVWDAVGSTTFGAVAEVMAVPARGQTVSIAGFVWSAGAGVCLAFQNCWSMAVVTYPSAGPPPAVPEAPFALLIPLTACAAAALLRRSRQAGLR